MSKIGELLLEVGLEEARKKEGGYLECWLEVDITSKNRRHTQTYRFRLAGLRDGHLAKTVIASGRQELAKQVGMASQNGTTVSRPCVVISL